MFSLRQILTLMICPEMTKVVILLLLVLMNGDQGLFSVDGSMYNAALYKPAYQSSLFNDFYAYLGNDGNNKDNLLAYHCQHTQSDVLPWWMVDLKGQFVIEKIVLTNRAELPTRLRNFIIDIFKTDPRQLPSFPSATGQICYSQIAPLNKGTFTWRCPAPIVGRFVRLIMMAQEYLHICEMEVYVSAANYKESLFLTRANRMLSVAPIMTINVPDAKACSQLCFFQWENDVKCTALNWLAGTGECQMLRVDPNDSTVLSSLVVQDGCTFVMEKN